MKIKLFFFALFLLGWNLFALEVTSLQGESFQDNIIQTTPQSGILIHNTSDAHISLKVTLERRLKPNAVNVGLYFPTQQKVEDKEYIIKPRNTTQINILTGKSFKSSERMVLTLTHKNLNTNQERVLQYALFLSSQANPLPCSVNNFYWNKPTIDFNSYFVPTGVLVPPRTFNPGGQDPFQLITLSEPQQATSILEVPLPSEEESDDELIAIEGLQEPFMISKDDSSYFPEKFEVHSRSKGPSKFDCEDVLENIGKARQVIISYGQNIKNGNFKFEVFLERKDKKESAQGLFLTHVLPKNSENKDKLIFNDLSQEIEFKIYLTPGRERNGQKYILYFCLSKEFPAGYREMYRRSLPIIIKEHKYESNTNINRINYIKGRRQVEAAIILSPAK